MEKVKEMAVSTNNQLAFVGALLTIVGLAYSLLTFGFNTFPFSSAPVFGLSLGLFLAPLSIIGFILFLLAMYGFSRDYQDSAIFNYILYGLIITIVVGIILVGVVLAFVFSSLRSIIETPGFTAEFSQNFLRDFLPVFLGASFLGLVSPIFHMLAFNRLAGKSGVRLFRTVGLLGVAAAAVTVAFWFLGAALFYMGVLAIGDIFMFSVVGSVVSLVSWILAAKAFRSIPMPTSQTYGTSPPPPPPSGGSVEYCPYCGTANALDAEYCVNCGKKL